MNRGDFLGGFAILVIFVSLITPAVLYLEVSQYSARESVTLAAVGTVSLTVAPDCGDAVCESGEDCSSCSADCGACAPSTPDEDTGGSSGGGGGSSSRRPVTYLFNFLAEDQYSEILYSGDTVILNFDSDAQYTFDITSVLVDNQLVFEYEGVEFIIYWDEVAYLDVDVDGDDDLKVSFISEHVVWTYLTSEVLPEGGSKSPVMKKEKVKFPSLREVSSPEGVLSLIIIFGVLLIGVGVVFYYQHHRLRRVEKIQSKKIPKLSKGYKSKDSSREEKSKYKEKLLKQKALLKESYDQGHVSKASYLKGKTRIENILKR
ncbi:hypothetical protein HN865_03220 [Candidatus Woesearchaeota archaeon]|jgi:hypothetical protein|nr:hypothetical protein [Candidatus Woesearchaeota archaeon]MBT7237843.1 hypothetical protein [Candidatus Woesearchaeota archaeon]